MRDAMGLLGGDAAIEAVHVIHKLVMQQIAVFVHGQFVCDGAAMEQLIVLGDLVLVIHVDLHAEWFFGAVFVLFRVLGLWATASCRRQKMVNARWEKCARKERRMGEKEMMSVHDLNGSNGDSVNAVLINWVLRI